MGEARAPASAETFWTRAVDTVHGTRRSKGPVMTRLYAFVQSFVAEARELASGQTMAEYAVVLGGISSALSSVTSKLEAVQRVKRAPPRRGGARQIAGSKNPQTGDMYSPLSADILRTSAVGPRPRQRRPAPRTGNAWARTRRGARVTVIKGSKGLT